MVVHGVPKEKGKNSEVSAHMTQKREDIRFVLATRTRQNTPEHARTGHVQNARTRKTKKPWGALAAAGRAAPCSARRSAVEQTSSRHSAVRRASSPRRRCCRSAPSPPFPAPPRSLRTPGSSRTAPMARSVLGSARPACLLLCAWRPKTQQPMSRSLCCPSLGRRRCHAGRPAVLAPEGRAV